VQCGVAEHRVELTVERQALRVAEPRIDAARSRRVHERGRAVDADDLRARGGDALGKRAVAAADVEDLLARLRREEFD
jgi:hypothetical protein